jgi:hypothetical protein
MVESTAPLALAFIGEIETQTGSCTRFQPFSQSNRSEKMSRLLLRRGPATGSAVRFQKRTETAESPHRVIARNPTGAHAGCQ